MAGIKTVSIQSGSGQVFWQETCECKHPDITDKVPNHAKFQCKHCGTVYVKDTKDFKTWVPDVVGE